jgi:hypothetical protein
MEEVKIGFVTTPALLLLALMCVLMGTLPRRLAAMPLLLAAFLMTQGQRFVVAGCYITFFRVVLLAGWARVLSKQENSGFQVNAIDKAFLWWVIVSVITGLLLDPTEDQLINRVGFAYDSLSAYFLMRFLVRDMDGVVRVIGILIGISVVLSVAMLVEKATTRNVFYMFGGVGQFAMERDGQLRCSGPFQHPILAGTVGATIMPLCLGLWIYDRKWRRWATIGLVASTIITMTSASSGPLLAWIYAIVAFLFWPLRNKMRAVRWGLLLGTIALHMVMKAPVWFLIGRLSSLTGGTGFHRSELIDACIKHFNEWWLLGTTYTAHWLIDPLPHDPNNCDITNQYIREATQGGVLKLILFILITVKCYQALGTILADEEGHRVGFRFMCWALGCALFAHLTSFISVAYFDQTIANFFWLVGFIACQVLSASSNTNLSEVPDPV